MKNHHISLAIILRKTQNGYLFESLQELSKDKSKKSKITKKPVNPKVPNRLIKQIGLSSEQIISQITPEPQPLPQIQQEPQQNVPIEQPNQQEQVSCQIDRETILPESPAFCFNTDKIHEMQKKQMNEYFMGKQGKSPQIYIKYRNFIYEAFKRNPKRYLTKIACRRMLRGDVNSIMRIHTFLQKHGIINYGIDYEGNYTFKSRPLFKQSQQKIKPQTNIKSIPENDEETTQKQIDVDNMTITPINKNFSRSYRANCSYCKLVCGVIWFANISENTESTQFNLCFECFQKLPKQDAKTYHKVDIIKSMEVHGREGKSYLKQAWSVEENLKLLDFISNQQNKSWRKLLQNLGGKRTIQDVILQFLQFPVSNVEITKLKKQLQDQLRKNKESEQIGFNEQDYFKILQNFYESSTYANKQCKKQEHQQRQQNLEGQNIKTQKNQQSQSFLILQKQVNSIKNVIQLVNKRTLTKIYYLKQKQKIIELQAANLQSTFSYRKNYHTLREDQPMNEMKNSSTEARMDCIKKVSSSDNFQNEDNQNESNYDANVN